MQLSRVAHWLAASVLPAPCPSSGRRAAAVVADHVPLVSLDTCGAGAGPLLTPNPTHLSTAVHETVLRQLGASRAASVELVGCHPAPPHTVAAFVQLPEVTTH